LPPFMGLRPDPPRGALRAELTAKPANVVKGMSLTTDPKDPDLGYGADKVPTPQMKKYLVLSEEERAKGFIRPVRQSYIHNTCRAKTTMALAIAETYARDPKFYGATYCCQCGMHLPVSEFTWEGTDELVGS